MQLPRYKKIFFIGITVIALGITLSTNMKDDAGSLGVLLVAIGGLLFIAAMSQRRKENEQ